ncbi:MAG: CBS domain-containing protein [Candidatus Enteromonas sp.]
MNIFPFLTLKSDTKFLIDTCTLRQALEKMEFYRYSVIPLLDENGRYIGTLSEGDLLRYVKKDLDFDSTKGEDVPISDIPRYRSYKPLSMESTLEELIELAMEQNFIPMVDDRGVFMGIIRRRTLLEYCKKELHDSLKEAL